MILRLSTPVARALLVLIAFVFAAGLSYSAVRNTLAVRYASLHTLAGYERATTLEPGDARNWYLLGRYWQYNLEDPDGPRAILAYQRSLSLDPHSADAWADLATAFESEDNLSAARDAFLQAQRAYPLSPEVSWRYGNFLLRRGELDSAFAQFKRSVQVDPKRGSAAFALCMRAQPDVNAVLDRVLPSSPAAYLNVISALAAQDQTDRALIVWDRLTGLHPHLPLSESFALIEALLHKRQMTEAQRVWGEALVFAAVSRPPDPPGSVIWDGGFESGVTNGGFTWRYSAVVDGVQVTVDSKEKHSGNHSLRFTFNGLRNVDFHDVCQYVAVQPSTSYRFSAWVQTRSLSTDQGIRFALYSIRDSNSSTSWTEEVHGTQPWTQIRLPWTSSSDVRELLVCADRVPSAKFDSKIAGSAWIDDVALVPESAQSTGQ